MEVALELGNRADEAGSVLRCMLEKAYMSMAVPLRAILATLQKEKRRAVEMPNILPK